MNATSFWQAVRLVVMVLAVAGIIYAVEFMPRGTALWFWVAFLGVGFVGLLWSFRITRRRIVREQGDSRLRKPRRR